jgi:UDP-N-acetylglucosamine/UDP-N-acetylgalactosamine diphosphorylase
VIALSSSEKDLRRDCLAHGQEHLFHFWDQLAARERAELLADIAGVDFALLRRLASGDGVYQSPPLNPRQVQAPDIYPSAPTAETASGYRDARRSGEDLLRAGRVAAMVVAGGQGTRLGFEGPKGCFAISPLRRKSLFQLFAESIRATQRRYGCRLPWYIMTSSVNDAATREFFQANRFFDLRPEDVFFFQQGMMPAVDDEGRILLEARHRLALSPNGHGGSLLALRSSGALADMETRGIEIVSYFQVDNPLVSPAYPLFLGLHRAAGAQFSSIAVPKADDLEKVGNFVRLGGRLQVIEYSDLPDELAHARNSDGARLLDAGNIAVHLLCSRFVAQLTGGGQGPALPWHRARKKVPFVDLRTGRLVQPDRPNATKFEMFIFDAIPLADQSILLQVPRGECFSPVKNAEGVDSAVTARRDMIRRAAHWLEECDLSVPRDASGEPQTTLEISPLLALDPAELKDRLGTRPPLLPGQSLYLE